MTQCIRRDITTMQSIHCLPQIFYSPLDGSNISPYYHFSLHTIMTSSGHRIQREERENTPFFLKQHMKQANMLNLGIKLLNRKLVS